MTFFDWIFFLKTGLTNRGSRRLFSSMQILSRFPNGYVIFVCPILKFKELITFDWKVVDNFWTHFLNQLISIVNLPENKENRRLFWSPPIYPSTHPNNKGFRPSFFGGLPAQNETSIFVRHSHIKMERLSSGPLGVCLRRLHSGDKIFEYPSVPVLTTTLNCGKKKEPWGSFVVFNQGFAGPQRNCVWVLNVRSGPKFGQIFRFSWSFIDF